MTMLSIRAMRVYVRFKLSLPVNLRRTLTQREFGILCCLMQQCRYHIPYRYRSAHDLAWNYVKLRSQQRTKLSMMELLYRSCWMHDTKIVNENDPIKKSSRLTYDDTNIIAQCQAAWIITWTKCEAAVLRTEKIALCNSILRVLNHRENSHPRAILTHLHDYPQFLSLHFPLTYSMYVKASSAVPHIVSSTTLFTSLIPNEPIKRARARASAVDAAITNQSAHNHARLKFRYMAMIREFWEMALGQAAYGRQPLKNSNELRFLWACVRAAVWWEDLEEIRLCHEGFEHILRNITNSEPVLNVHFG